VRTLFLIDGEHYPPVVIEAIRSIEESRGAVAVAAAFLGGTEKIGAETDYGLPLVRGADSGDPISAVREALASYEVEAAVDLSDEPVIGYRDRMRIASLVLHSGARYIGADFELRPPNLVKVSKKPALAVTGTGKRVGKTAVAGYLARLLDAEGFAPGVVSMGRGGPPEPEVVQGGRMQIGGGFLLEALERGAHAASDYYETAALSRVVTVGCRRCGGGLAGEPFVSNVLEGAEIANDLDTRTTIFDGSGAVVPPVEVGGRVLVAGAHQDPEYITGYLGAYRVLISDLLVLTMSEEPMAGPEKVAEITRAVQELKPEMKVIPVVFRPRPLGDVRGLRLAYISTAPERVLSRLGLYLESEYGCEVVGASGALSDRRRLEEDLDRMDEADAYLTEIKAAAIDVVARRAGREGKQIFYCDNEPVGDGLDAALLGMARRATSDFEG
jgi:cyclic 2,3-diphosphoglycerate synthetase